MLMLLMLILMCECGVCLAGARMMANQTMLMLDSAGAARCLCFG